MKIKCTTKNILTTKIHDRTACSGQPDLFNPYVGLWINLLVFYSIANQLLCSSVSYLSRMYYIQIHYHTAYSFHTKTLILIYQLDENKSICHDVRNTKTFNKITHWICETLVQWRFIWEIGTYSAIIDRVFYSHAMHLCLTFCVAVCLLLPQNETPRLY